MQSLPNENRKQKDNKENQDINAYIKYLEKKHRNLETENQLLKDEIKRLNQNLKSLRTEFERITDLPLITGTISDIMDDDRKRAIIRSSTGPSYVVSASTKIKKEDLTPGASVGLNQRTLAIVNILPSSKDPFVMSFELVEFVPDISYNEIGGLDKEIQEIREIVEFSLTKRHLFEKIGIEPPKGVLLHGPPGTGKTLIAKAIAHEAKATFIRIIGSELVDKFIGEGARFVREVFKLAQEKAPTILFIDEIDAIGAARLEDATSGDREVQRTLLQLMSELDGFDNRGDVKFIAATNRIDILDEALLRPGRFDRIVEFPMPNEEARKEIFKIHMRYLKVNDNINFERLIEMTEGATGADIKAICTEAGMFAIRNDNETIKYTYLVSAIEKVMKKIYLRDTENNLFV